MDSRVPWTELLSQLCPSPDLALVSWLDEFRPLVKALSFRSFLREQVLTPRGHWEPTPGCPHHTWASVLAQPAQGSHAAQPQPEPFVRHTLLVKKQSRMTDIEGL